ncbi:MAG: hypothetical protein ACJ71U_00600 [Terriglobales bacterium]
MATEDERAAATIRATLSASLMAAVFAIIAAQAAIVTFTVEKKGGLHWFTVYTIVGFLSLIVSLFFGGKGIATLYKDGYNAQWKAPSAHDSFVIQGLTGLLGLALVFASLACGTDTGNC